MGVVVGSPHFVCVAPSSLGEDSSHSSPVPVRGPSHGRQSSLNFSNVSPSHRLQFFTNCSNTGPSYQKQAAPLWVCHGVTSPASKPAPAWTSLSPQGRTSCQESAPCRVSMGSQPTLGIHLLWCGVLHGLQVEICATMDRHGLQGHSLPHHGLHHRLQGKLCSRAWSTSSPSFCTDLGVCRAVLVSYSRCCLPAAVAQWLSILS